ncbi:MULTISPECIES: ABC transporter ATP-binding protein [unclassified Planococcus (in: firmicutes)]|uniref:ABC transporter ATP-binding protein n=1 Tax=unclassified Planococcus (in: firmicutes) TaxID=2662419 RepID=UPI000C7B45F0|nr:MULTISPECIES: ABC transporter ATP-binding protein [unclassified Planococcus (in: firmicutes)]PKG46627.1 export ABC transporter ATP-binding protein [Planococcus sp. Urea-trap-24]PKG89520.1 export ABC transporter ATP-binding protein [Planococcus sp. Urea-3u-39]PKH42046.1 export ABC transporter ATP-binding protein [Planococcus sp. MB-3u-09]
MLETQQLTKKFKDTIAVNEVSLVLRQGESVGLLGPNGAGKSTAIAMISTLMKPSSGDVRLNGKSVLKKPAEMRRVLGVVPQKIALYEELSAYENLKFFGRLYGLSGNKLEQRIDYVLELVGLADRKKELVKNYSGGMQRRVNLAAAMMHEPEVLIMDEPTVGIDPQSRNHLLETIRKLNQDEGMTVLYTSHYMEEVEKLCDRVYIMDHGKVIAEGTKEELKAILSDQETVLIEFDQHYPELFTKLSEIEGVQHATAEEHSLKLIIPKGTRLLGALFHEAERYGAQVVNVNVQTPTLEDVFLRLTGRKLRD